MTRKPKPRESEPKGARLELHPCHLQGMSGDRFVRIANRILVGQLTLLRFRDANETGTPSWAAAN